MEGKTAIYLEQENALACIIRSIDIFNYSVIDMGENEVRVYLPLSLDHRVLKEKKPKEVLASFELAAHEGWMNPKYCKDTRLINGLIAVKNKYQKATNQELRINIGKKPKRQ